MLLLTFQYPLLVAVVTDDDASTAVLWLLLKANFSVKLLACLLVHQMYEDGNGNVMGITSTSVS